MRVHHLGDGEPSVAVVGAIHGDEPCGAEAIDRLVADEPAVDRPVKFVVANEEALERGVRYVDADLNRAFGEDADPDAHEYALAQRLVDELSGCTALSLHSTQSHAEPFGIANGIDDPIGSIVPNLSVAALVDIDADEGRPFALEPTDLLEVETGFQGSDEAAENAYRIAREFLTATGVLPGQTVARDVPVYRLGEPVEKPPAERYEVFVENFTRVDAGEVFAAADDQSFVAEEAFYPVLMSAYGYREVFGYAGDRLGVLEAPQERTA